MENYRYFYLSLINKLYHSFNRTYKYFSELNHILHNIVDSYES